MDGRACCVIAAGGGLGGVRDTGDVAAGMGMGTGTGNSCRFGRTGFPRDSYVFGVG